MLSIETRATERVRSEYAHQLENTTPQIMVPNGACPPSPASTGPRAGYHDLPIVLHTAARKLRPSDARRWDRGESHSECRAAGGGDRRPRPRPAPSCGNDAGRARGRPVHEAVREPDRARRDRALRASCSTGWPSASASSACSSRPGSAAADLERVESGLADGERLLDEHRYAEALELFRALRESLDAGRAALGPPRRGARRDAGR